MKKIVQTIVEGTVGLLALYVVARTAYDAGHRMAKAECRYEQLSRKEAVKSAEAESKDEEPTPEPVKLIKAPARPGWTGVLSKFGKAVCGRGVIGRILKDPDGQRVEMYVEDDTFRIDVKSRK